MNITNEEEWRPVPGYEDSYSVSNLGQVRRDLVTQYTGGGLLKPYKRKSGYEVLALTRYSKRRMFLVHRLVAMAFIEQPIESIRQHINHKNGVKNDNRACNLEWVTPQENVDHATNVLGLDPKARNRAPYGQVHYKARLTTIQARMIRDLYQKLGDNMNQAAIAREYRVHHNTIWALIHGRSWKKELDAMTFDLDAMIGDEVKQEREIANNDNTETRNGIITRHSATHLPHSM